MYSAGSALRSGSGHSADDAGVSASGTGRGTLAPSSGTGRSIIFD